MKYLKDIKEKIKMERELLKGEVIWFNNNLGYGFIAREDGGKDLFAHYTNIVTDAGKFRTLVAGQKVSFTVGTNNTGPQAENIVVIEEAPIAEE